MTDIWFGTPQSTRVHGWKIPRELWYRALDTRNLEICTRFANGETYTQLSRAYNLKKRNLCIITQRYQVQRGTGTNRRYTEKEIAAMIRMSKRHTAKEIATRFRADYKNVRRLLKKAGVVLIRGRRK